MVIRSSFGVLYLKPEAARTKNCRAPFLGIELALYQCPECRDARPAA
jgi:hypothetical protein